MWPASYRIEDKVKPRQSFLDPNHTHFILVDNGSQNQFAVEIPFRAKLEESIGGQKTDTGEGKWLFIDSMIIQFQVSSLLFILIIVPILLFGVVSGPEITTLKT